MRIRQVMKAIADYKIDTGADAAGVYMSDTVFAEVCQEMGATSSSGLCYLQGIPLYASAIRPDNEIDVDGPAGRKVYTIAPVAPPATPTTPDYAALLRTFIADFATRTGDPVGLIQVSPAVFGAVSAGLPTYTVDILGVPYTAISFQYAEVVCDPAVPNNVCIVSRDEYSPLLTYLFHRPLALHPAPSPAAPGALSGVTGAPLGGHSPILDYDKIYTDPACECGSEKVGSPAHSSWCPKHS